MDMWGGNIDQMQALVRCCRAAQAAMEAVAA